MLCERCGRQLNTQYHTFRGVPLCVDCHVLTNEVYRELRYYLHALARRGEALIEAGLRAGEPLEPGELKRKLLE